MAPQKSSGEMRSKAFTGVMYNHGMAKADNIKTVNIATQQKAFTGIKRRPITIQKPGTVNPTETLRRLRDR
jgi:hypothetical protein